MDLTEAKRFIECEKRVGAVHPHPGMVQSLVAEVERLRLALKAAREDLMALPGLKTDPPWDEQEVKRLDNGVNEVVWNIKAAESAK